MVWCSVVLGAGARTITALQWAENHHVGHLLLLVFFAVGQREAMDAVVFGEGGGEREGGEEEEEGRERGFHFFFVLKELRSEGNVKV